MVAEGRMVEVGVEDDLIDWVLAEEALGHAVICAEREGKREGEPRSVALAWEVIEEEKNRDIVGPIESVAKGDKLRAAVREGGGVGVIFPEAELVKLEFCVGEGGREALPTTEVLTVGVSVTIVDMVGLGLTAVEFEGAELGVRSAERVRGAL